MYALRLNAYAHQINDFYNSAKQPFLLNAAILSGFIQMLFFPPFDLVRRCFFRGQVKKLLCFNMYWYHSDVCIIEEPIKYYCRQLYLWNIGFVIRLHFNSNRFLLLGSKIFQREYHQEYPILSRSLSPRIIENLIIL